MKSLYPFVLFSCLLMGCPDEDRFDSQTLLDMMQQADTPTNEADMMVSEQDAQSETTPTLDMGIDAEDAISDMELDIDDAAAAFEDSSMPDEVIPDGLCRVEFQTAIPSDTNQDRVYLAGSFCQNSTNNCGDCCNWTTDDPNLGEDLNARADGIAYFAINLPPNIEFAYKYTQGTWEREEMRFTDPGTRAPTCTPRRDRVLNIECPEGMTFVVRDTIDIWKPNCP